MEKGTKEFYSLASDRATNPDAKKTFRVLSEWEGTHMDFMQFLYQSIMDDKDINTFEEFKKKAFSPVTEAGIPVKDLEARMEKYNFDDELSALTLAMEIEGKAYNLYNNFSKNAEDANARIVFKELMEQELKHVEYLKDLRLKLVKVY